MRASLFVTCLSDLFFPQVGEAVVKILRRQNIQVDFPAAQTCCGQPLINSGYKNETLSLAKRFIEIFEDSEYIVTPSGSCALIVKQEYPRVLTCDARWRERAERVAAKTFEFTAFLVRVLGVTDLGATMNARVTYHDSCHLNRGLGVRDEPRQLLRAVRGLELVEMKNSETCCGFGGSFSVRYPDISVAMLSDKIRWIEESGAQILVAGDAGCSMHLAGALARRESRIRLMHIAQLLGEATGDE